MKNNEQAYRDVFKQHGITKLYHFTDRDNLQSIINNGGLHSWADCEQKGISIAKPGGDDLSRGLDMRRNHQHYVRVSFTRQHPMMYVAMQDGRISNPVILEISTEVITQKETLFADRNAVKGSAQIGGGVEDLKRIHFDTVKEPNHFNLAEEEREFYQAEVLVKNFIPLSMITNIADFGITIPASTPATAQTQQPAIQLHEPYTAPITRATPTAFIFMVDHSGSMSNTTHLYGHKMTCAEAVAQVLNSQIHELVSRCVKMDEVRHYFDIAVIGYGRDVYSAWKGDLEGRDFVTPSELCEHPYKKCEIKKQRMIRGKLTEYTVEEPVWFEARHDGRQTNYHLALQKAKLLAEEWIKNHDAECYPPTIINITDGAFNNSSHETRMHLANFIKSLYTKDGNVLMFNVHITPNNVSSVSFPTCKAELGENRYAEELYELSSLLPQVYNARIAQMKDIPLEERHVAMSVNADMQQLVKIMDIGTPTNIRNK